MKEYCYIDNSSMEDNNSKKYIPIYCETGKDENFARVKEIRIRFWRASSPHWGKWPSSLVPEAVVHYTPVSSDEPSPKRKLKKSMN